MRILVIGGSSFVGAHLCRLGTSSHEMIAVFHETPVKLRGVTSLQCDLRDDKAVRRLRAQNADAVVQLAFKVKRGAGRRAGAEDPVSALNRRIMDVTLALERPVVYASSTVVHWEQDSAYARDRRDDEARLHASGLPFAIVRPCAPYGPRLREHRPGHQESFHTLADLVRRTPVVPVIGNGRYRRQPVHVDDFNGAILALIERGLPSAAYDSGGADALSFDALIDALAAASARRVRKVHIPKPVFVRLARFSRDFDPELLSVVDSDDVADPTSLARASGVTPRPFAQGAPTLYLEV